MVTCDNLLVAAYLSAKCPVYFAPNGFRYVQASLYYCKFSSLTQFGNTIIPAESGELASGQVKEEWPSQKI
jgi:phosphopantothenoylcysteine decarboxylase/phosphopantothenate--cysteine ligase